MADLDLLLDEAATALMAGDFGALSRLTPQIERARVTAADSANAIKLQTKALRNARLLEAATRGIKAARLRVDEIVRGPVLTTYDARGLKAMISPPGMGSARRV